MNHKEIAHYIKDIANLLLSESPDIHKVLFELGCLHGHLICCAEQCDRDAGSKSE